LLPNYYLNTIKFKIVKETSKSTIMKIISCGSINVLCVLFLFHVIFHFNFNTNNILDDWQNNIQWPNGLTSSQSMGFNDVAPWSADFSNPFKVIYFKFIVLYLFKN